ncbi:MAG TPA: ComEC/Rec2 family competence protein [Gaiellaceae bacterium]|nr:ComEC/Rec2 family competence protein [Gaiellaceae bacterium]
MSLIRRRPAHAIGAALCLGLALSNGIRASSWILLVAALALALVARRGPVLAVALVLVGWWWGSVRLDAIDRSPLTPRIGTAERTRFVVTGQPRLGRFEMRLPATVLRFGELHVHEPVLAQLPSLRAPPQGAVVEGRGELEEPPGARNGFDERTWLRRHGVHAVLRVDLWRVVGRRDGLGGVADRLRAWLAGSVARGLHGERRSVLEGIVLGDDSGLSDGLQQRFRASGLYHLLAVSGENVALVAAGALALAWLVGLPRWLGEFGALAGIAGYVLAVGPQPSVIRAGIAGALGSLAWLSARMTDRWYFLILGAIVLLAWNPYTLLDAGFQLSFAAVASIFLVVPRLRRALDGYPGPGALRDVVSVSAACGLATAPVTWLQFHAIPLLTIPANALAAPAMAPLLGLALVGALLAPVVPSATIAIAWMNGWLAAYIAECARVVGGLPGAQIRSAKALALIVAGVLVVAAYAWPRWRTSSSPST